MSIQVALFPNKAVTNCLQW